MSAGAPISIDDLPRGQALARFTAARLGGRADYLYIAKDPSFSDLIPLLDEARRRRLPVTIIGGGANVLVSDAGIRGLTIVNRAARIQHEDKGERAVVTAWSGANLIRLARYCCEHGLSGMEWAIAVPGTVGGAVVNNAGAHASDIAGSLRRALIYEAGGGEGWIAAKDMGYGYRTSRLKESRGGRCFIMRAEFIFERDEPAAIQQRMEAYNQYRRQTQPLGASLGSIFKNPPGDYAGRLIEAAGLKGYSRGAVQVSPVHANFLVNLSAEASACDYLALIELARERVKERFGIELELEIQLLGEWRRNSA